MEHVSLAGLTDFILGSIVVHVVSVSLTAVLQASERQTFLFAHHENILGSRKITTSFLPSAQYEDEWPASHLGRFTSRDRGPIVH